MDVDVVIRVPFTIVRDNQNENRCGARCPYLVYDNRRGRFACELFKTELTPIPAVRNIACIRAEQSTGT